MCVVYGTTGAWGPNSMPCHCRKKSRKQEKSRMSIKVPNVFLGMTIVRSDGWARPPRMLVCTVWRVSLQMADPDSDCQQETRTLVPSAMPPESRIHLHVREVSTRPQAGGGCGRAGPSSSATLACSDVPEHQPDSISTQHFAMLRQAGFCPVVAVGPRPDSASMQADLVFLAACHWISPGGCHALARQA